MTYQIFVDNDTIAWIIRPEHVGWNDYFAPQAFNAATAREGVPTAASISPSTSASRTKSVHG